MHFPWHVFGSGVGVSGFHRAFRVSADPSAHRARSRRLSSGAQSAAEPRSDGATVDSERVGELADRRIAYGPTRRGPIRSSRDVPVGHVDAEDRSRPRYGGGNGSSATCRRMCRDPAVGPTANQRRSPGSSTSTRELSGFGSVTWVFLLVGFGWGPDVVMCPRSW